MKKHSRAVSKIIFLFLAAALIGCGREPRRTDFVARVNNSYLTEKDIEKIISSSEGKNFYRNEIIRNWVNREILYQKALDEGIPGEEEYTRIIDASKKELAASMLLDMIYNKEEITVEDKDIEEYYNLHKEEFRLNEDHYLLNKAAFRTEGYAIAFRTSAVENNWETALEDMSESAPLKEKSFSLLTPESGIHPFELLRIVRELYPGEVSIVVSNMPEEYIIVQMLRKFGEGTIPPPEIITEKVKNRILKKKKDELIKNYIQELYSASDIEIRQN